MDPTAGALTWLMTVAGQVTRSHPVEAAGKLLGAVRAVLAPVAELLPSRVRPLQKALADGLIGSLRLG